MKPKILFICGTVRHTELMHEISKNLGQFESHFSPNYDDGLLGFLSKIGIIKSKQLEKSNRKEVENYLISNFLNVDPENQYGDYDLIFTNSDRCIPFNIRNKKIVLVKNEITRKNLTYYFRKTLGLFKYISGNNSFGFVNAYKLCFVPNKQEKKVLSSFGINDNIIFDVNTNQNAKIDLSSAKFIANKTNEYYSRIVNEYNKLILNFSFRVF